MIEDPGRVSQAKFGSARETRGGWKTSRVSVRGRTVGSSRGNPAGPGNSIWIGTRRRARGPTGSLSLGAGDKGKAGRPEHIAPEHGAGRSGIGGAWDSEGLAAGSSASSPASIQVEWAAAQACAEHPASADRGASTIPIRSTRGTPIERHRLRSSSVDLINRLPFCRRHRTPAGPPGLKGSDDARESMDLRSLPYLRSSVAARDHPVRFLS